ncbi:MAG: hypothetical protein RIS64_2534 [Bacteroidota bacterium]|jgi:hypothetical protein
MEKLHAQCYPPLEKRKMVIVKEQSPYLSAFQFENHPFSWQKPLTQRKY